MDLFYRHLETAQTMSILDYPERRNVVVAGLFRGRTPVLWRINTQQKHAEEQLCHKLISMKSGLGDTPDRIVVYRFNRIDASRTPRASCPCSKCAIMIKKSGVKLAEYYSDIGHCIVHVGQMSPYRQFPTLDQTGKVIR